MFAIAEKNSGRAKGRSSKIHNYYTCWEYVNRARLRLILVLGYDNYLAKFGNQAVNDIVEGAREKKQRIICEGACMQSCV